MKIKYTIRLFVIALAISLLFTSNIIAVADVKSIDINTKGSVTLNLRDINKKAPEVGAGVTIYKIADAKEKNSNVTFEFTDDFKNSKASIDELETEENFIAKRLENFAKMNNINGIEKFSDSKGNVTFDNLSVGWYLLVQSASVNGFTDFTSFVTRVPSDFLGETVYDVYAQPKITSNMLSKLDLVTVEKIWIDDIITHNPIKVGLYEGENLIDTITLSESNKWFYAWENLDVKGTLSVKELDVPDEYEVNYYQDDYDFIIKNTPKTPLNPDVNESTTATQGTTISEDSTTNEDSAISEDNDTQNKNKTENEKEKLPRTGQINWPIPLFMIMGLVLIIVGIPLSNSKTGKNDD